MGNASVAQKAPDYGPDYLSVYETDGPHYTSKPDGQLPIRLAKAGPASSINDGKTLGAKPCTVTDLLQMAAESSPDMPALCYEDGLPPLKSKTDKPAPMIPRDQWKTITYKEYHQLVRKAAKAMIKLGLAKHDACNVFGFNSVEWFVAQMGVITAGGRVAGIYPTDTPDQFAFKNNHSNGSIVCVDTEANFKKIASKVQELPYLKAIVHWGVGRDMDDIKRSDGSSVKVLQWDAFLALGEEAALEEQLDKRVSAQKPEECCALIYTSGTTGFPKAVMSSHDNIVFASNNLDCNQLPEWADRAGKQERILSYLPLSHVAGMLIDIINPVATTALDPGYCTVYFARNYDLKVGSMGDRLRAVEPTLFFGVPRVYEKIADKIKAVGAKTKGVARKIANWAKAKVLDHQKSCQIGGDGYRPWGYSLAERLLVKKIKATLGLSECKLCMTAAAPIQFETLEFFGNLGICICEIYGMSECNGTTTWSSLEAHQWGSVGYQLPGTEVKILKPDPADAGKFVEAKRAEDIFNATEDEQGEICFRGRHIMMGYMANPKLGSAHVEEIEKKNAGAIDKDGWLHSGDKGCMSVQGMLKITGRYKELIITAGGENVAPVPIEDGVKKRCPAVSNVMMIGDKRKFNVALVTLKAVGATGEFAGGDDLAEEAIAAGSGATTISEAMDDKAIIETITKAIAETNDDGTCCPSNASRIQKFMILPRDFSVDTEELTATLKLKRGTVNTKYEKQISMIYDSKDTYVKFQE